jgi:hypothetical protein
MGEANWGCPKTLAREGLRTRGLLLSLCVSPKVVERWESENRIGILVKKRDLWLGDGCLFEVAYSYLQKRTERFVLSPFADSGSLEKDWKENDAAQPKSGLLPTQLELAFFPTLFGRNRTPFGF